MTLIEGDKGVVVVDTLNSIDGARAAMELYFQHRGKRPVSAVIFTHTHTDHWGGARGVLDDETLASGRVPVVAPNLFMSGARVSAAKRMSTLGEHTRAYLQETGLSEDEIAAFAGKPPVAARG